MAFERSQKNPPTKNKCVKDLVNEITPYEQLIAAKLDQVPVPDMADAIWSSIDMELDAAASSSVDVPRASAFKGIGWYGLAAIVVVAALLYWYFSHHASTVPPKALPEMHAPLPVEPPPVGDSPVSDKPGKMPVLPARTRKDTVLSHFPADSLRVDSASSPVLPSSPKVDSSALQKNRPNLPDVDLYGSPPPLPRGKKPKGVKGIGEDDYKITASKDSGKKN